MDVRGIPQVQTAGLISLTAVPDGAGIATIAERRTTVVAAAGPIIGKETCADLLVTTDIGIILIIAVQVVVAALRDIAIRCGVDITIVVFPVAGFCCARVDRRIAIVAVSVALVDAITV